MNHPRDEIFLTVLCIAVVTVVSGPLVPGIDLTPVQGPQAGNFESLNNHTGDLEATSIQIPDTGYRLERGVRGSGIYTTRFPATTVEIETVSGSVLLVYAVDIPALGYGIQSTYEATQTSPRTLNMTLPQSQLKAQEITQESYQGVATVYIRTNGTKRALTNKTVTVTVSGGGQ
ncbi:hypothetical protein ACOZ4B_08890 [Haloferax prahovense]|uniref:hypothetical protein n=1 Tax=Haloferax prahovense TaxID=381852 RepID=UPI003C74DBEC